MASRLALAGANGRHRPAAGDLVEAEQGVGDLQRVHLEGADGECAHF